MSITAADVNKLRQMTGAGMMDCKKALTQANGDFEAAIDFLRKTGQKVSAARADRSTTEGAVFIKTNADETEAYIVALGCETDFVAKNEDFTGFGELLVSTAFDNKIGTAEDLLNAQVNGRSLSEQITDMIGKIGEKLDVVSLAKVSGDKIVSYLHSNKKVGVLVALNGSKEEAAVELGKDIAMQIAAMKPIALDKEDVDATTIEREIEIGKDLARQEGKPEAMLEKIAQGRLAKFFKESTLLNQEFVKDPSRTIRQLLEQTDKNLSVKEFKRISIGG